VLNLAFIDVADFSDAEQLRAAEIEGVSAALRHDVTFAFARFHTVALHAGEQKRCRSYRLMNASRQSGRAHFASAASAIFSAAALGGVFVSRLMSTHPNRAEPLASTHERMYPRGMSDEVKPEIDPFQIAPCPNLDSIGWGGDGIDVYTNDGKLFAHLPIGSETMIMNRHVAAALGEIDASRARSTVTQQEIYDTLTAMNLLDVRPCSCNLAFGGPALGEWKWTRMDNPKCEQHHPEKTS
jgi:hypothetical protein